MKDYSSPLADTLKQIVADGIEGTSLAEPATKLDLMKLGLALLSTHLAVVDVALSSNKSKEDRRVVAERFGDTIGQLTGEIMNLAPEHSGQLSSALNEYFNGKG